MLKKTFNLFVVLLTVVATGGVALAQDSSLPTYTWSKPAKSIVFNSITNNPNVGDERNFLKVRSYDNNSYTDDLKVVDGQEVVLMAYYDNNAASNYDLKSKNTRLRIDIPATTTRTHTITASILSDNAKPKTVTDTTQLSADQPFNLKYESGSAQIWNNSLRGTNISDNVINQAGAPLGYQKLDGVIQGGPLYSGYVTIKAKVSFPATSLSKNSVGVVANTGPGSTLALFAGATLLGTLLHHRRRAKSTY